MLFVGLGCNLLVRDGGLRGTVIFHARRRRNARSDGDGVIYAEAGVASPKVARFAAAHDFVGAEFLAGIPGTVGGALAMNAGCYGGETWDIVDERGHVDRSGQIHERGTARLRDRLSALPSARRQCEEWFVGGMFELPARRRRTSRARIKELLARRIATQPLQLPNAGSVFRNPPGDHAARLIEACGLKGLARGGARVSEKHANFIVNPDGPRARPTSRADPASREDRPARHTGVELVPEVRIVGEPA